MDRELIQNYLRRAEMNDAQAEALSRIFAEMATKGDLLVFQEQVERRLEVFGEQMAHLRTDLTGQMAHLRTDLTGQMAHLRTDLTGQITQIESEFSGEIGRQFARQTKWMIAAIMLFGTVITIVNAFIG